MTVNVSTIEANLSTQEYVYFCMYTDYNQFHKMFISRSTKRYWMDYSGSQCHRKQLSRDQNSFLKDTFSISQPNYVFIGIGSTIEPLSRFQYTISVSGQIISDPGHSLSDDFTEEFCRLGDQHHSCELALNLALNDSEALCIVGSRPMAVIHLSKTDNKIYGQEGMCVN